MAVSLFQILPYFAVTSLDASKQINLYCILKIILYCILTLKQIQCNGAMGVVLIYVHWTENCIVNAARQKQYFTSGWSLQFSLMMETSWKKRGILYFLLA